jgi:hypothetical protein
MIGSLLYLCAYMPDIMLSVCMWARFQANPKECHLMVVKRIFRYLVHTPNLGLWYPKGFTFNLLGYSDLDYVSYKVDRKSTSGTWQFLGRSLVSWSSKKQNYVALSTVEAEYVAAALVVLIYFGWGSLWEALVVSLARCHSCVTMRVPSR